MKRFLIKVSIVGVAVVALLTTLELYVRSIPNEYSYKHKYLDTHIDSIQVLALGSSIGRSGIDPECFDTFTFNAANVSQDLETDCAIIDKYLSRADNLQIVIFTLLPGSYCSRMGEGIESWRLRKYSIYMDLDIDKPRLTETLEIFDLNKTLKQIIKGLKGQQTVECYEKGMGTDSDIEPESEKLAQAIRISKIHNEGYTPSNYDIIVPKIKTTIQQLIDKGKEVYLVMMPVHKTYSERIDLRMLSECDSISKSIESMNPHVHFLNMFTDSSFTTGDFRNSNHLSQEGAKKISTKLNEIIRNYAE